MNFWRALSFAGFLLGWLERASRDGKITTNELIELVTVAVDHFGLDVEIDVPKPVSDTRLTPRTTAGTQP